MSEKLEVYEGKIFSVALQSMFGSTPYGWCLKSMPEGVILMGCENVPAVQGGRIGPVNQIFYFGLQKALDQKEAALEFILTSAIDITDVGKSVKIEFSIVSAEENKEQEVEYSKNGAIYRSKNADAVGWPPMNESTANWPPVNWPPVNGSTANWPPVNWPPVNGSTANWPPVNWPPVNETTVNWPPVNWPPVNGSAANWPPVNWPPVNETTVNWPPVNWPPVNGSAANWPPVNWPPVN